MLAYLRGTIESKEMTGGAACRLVLDVAGVGFDLHVSQRTLAKVGAVGQAVTVHTAVAIRENDWTIFGFAQKEEREMFNLVQSVSGIGPKLALALVGTFDADDLVNAILAEDHKFVSQAPGVGAKVAQRLILELKAKLEDWHARRGQSDAGAGSTRNANVEEARSILGGLGYTPTEISSALKTLDEEQMEGDVESLVRQSLKVLGSVAQ